MKLISVFQNLKLSQKFMLAVSLLLAGVLFLGVSYYQTLSLEHLAQKRNNELQAFTDKIDEINVTVLDSKLLQQSFFLDRNLQILTQFEDKMAELSDTIDELDPYLENEKERQVIASFYDIIDTYQEQFYESVNLAIDFGLDISEGLQSEYIGSLQTLELLIQNANMDTLSEHMSTLTALGYRTLETDQLETIRKSINAEIEAMQRITNTSPFEDDVLKQEILKDLIDVATMTGAVIRSRLLQNSVSYQISDTVAAIDPQITNLNSLVSESRAASELQRKEDAKSMNSLFLLSMFMMFVALIFASFILQQGVVNPVRKIQNAIERIRTGDNKARSELEQQDEIGQLSQTLDQLMDEKEKSLEEKEAENARLNSSVISLIQNVFMLSEKDLTVRVPVSEDITGAVADSINQLAVSMNEVLHEVTDFADQVTSASTQVKAQSGTVITYAEREQEEINQTLKGLESVVKAMQVIAKLAYLSSKSSQRAIETSEAAMSSVNDTVASINKIHQTIHNAEKRIKRLGERSQEIGGIINLINSISERTHVLSLNASMHASSAGEAGRGLMVVVDEVQRLAESSREATAEIEGLISNIQADTADTIEVINQVITDVVEGTRLAEQAGARMEETKETTESLVDSVVRISQSAVKQARLTEQLQQRAARINDTTAATNEEMTRQEELSNQLVASVESLKTAVSGFRLADRTTQG